MSTRGALVFRCDGIDRITYNHCDSYPSGLGAKVAAHAATLTDPAALDAARAQVRALVAVRDNAIPTPEERAAFEASYRNVSGGRDWYSLLRGVQGNPAAILQCGRYIDSTTAFLADSLFCEWAYVINFDTAEVEVYCGFQHSPHTHGRYASLPVEPGAKYHPVALIDVRPFGAPAFTEEGEDE